MNKLAEILKRHIWCVIIIAVIMLLSLITLSFGEDVDLVSHLSLASAIVSIVLAVIVIIYTFFQNQRSSQNIAEMKNLIDEGYRTMTDKADLMVNQTQSLEQMMTGITQPPADGKQISTPLVLQGGGTLDVSVYGYWGLLTLYSLAKSHELEKPMSMKSISRLTEEEKDASLRFWCYGTGAIQSIQAFLGEDNLIYSHEQQEVKKLPDGFKKSVTAQIDSRLEKYKDEGKDENYTELKNHLSIIDNYFDKL